MKEGWQKLTLGEAFATTTGGTPPKTEYSLYGDYIPFVKPPELNDTTIETAADGLSQDGAKVARTLPVNSILVSCIGNLGKIGLNTIPVAFNQQINAILPNEKIALPWFMFYQVLGPAFKDQLQVQASGTTVQIVNKSKFNSIAIVLPEIKEQHRIVTLLDKAFADIATAKANAEKNLQNARSLFESRMQTLFDEDQNWERVQLENLLSRGWITSHLDGNHGSDYPKKEEFVDYGVPYIAARALRSWEVDFSEAKYLTPERASTIRKGLAQDGDVLFAHNATVGPVGVLKTKEPFVILGTSLTYYRCNEDFILPEYLAHYMRSPAFVNQYSQVMKQSTRNQVPITKQREFLHVIPPLSIQKKIATDLDSLSAKIELIESIYRQKITALDALKKSLLHQAFSGQL